MTFTASPGGKVFDMLVGRKIWKMKATNLRWLILSSLSYGQKKWARKVVKGPGKG
jgi:hypothetical protein